MEILDVQNLTTVFKTRRGRMKAVNGVSFTARKAETLAIVGESGSGKSVASLSVMGLIPRPGKVSATGIFYKKEDLLTAPKERLRQLRGNEISMIFQEPMTSLNPVLSIRFQLVEAIRAHLKLSKREALERAVEQLRIVGIPSPEKRISDFPHEISGGMRQRVMIAMALSCNPELLIADEPTTAIDVTIQAQIMDLLTELRSKIGMGVILITHDLGVVAENADRVVVMYCGKIVEEAPVKEIFKNSAHPYSAGLINSIPRMDIRVARLPIIRGTVPNLLEAPDGCNFSNRCDYCMEKCKREIPKLVKIGEGHFVRCFLHSAETEV
jgi:peptide/nickel transport system ATP-binding protein